MTSATEIRKILHQNTQARMEVGKRKALQALDVIDACIHNAVKECNTHTEVHVMRLCAFDNDDEKQTYLITLRNELKNNGYTATFCATSGVMRIVWGY